MPLPCFVSKIYLKSPNIYLLDPLLLLRSGDYGRCDKNLKIIIVSNCGVQDLDFSFFLATEINQDESFRCFRQDRDMFGQDGVVVEVIAEKKKTQLWNIFWLAPSFSSLC